MAEYDRPEFEVWNHLESGLDLARAELRVLDAAYRAVADRVADLIAKFRDDLFVSPGDAALAETLEQLLVDPWIRHAAEIEIARGGVDRASRALDRYKQLRPVAVNYMPDSRARRYLKEAADAFLLGFDAACIAFCGAAMEQLLKQLLVERRLISLPGSENEWSPSGSELLRIAVLHRCIVNTEAAARRLIKQRNRVMHRSMWEPTAIAGVAISCINDLAAVLTELPADEPLSGDVA